MKCFGCGKMLLRFEDECKSCGWIKDENTTRCENCEVFINGDQVECPKCGWIQDSLPDCEEL